VTPVSKTAINDVQKALNVIRSTVADEDRDTQLATLALLNVTSDSIIQIAKRLGDAQPKTKTQKVAIPQTRVVKQPSPQQQTSRDDEREKRDNAPQNPQPPLTPQQQREQ
jgi:hypothetical protein